MKASSVPLMIEAYRQLSEATDHPLHLGVTEAGPPPTGTLKATAGIATLLAEGIGDTIRYSSLPIRSRRPRPAVNCSRPWACAAQERRPDRGPSCGRAEVDVYTVAQDAMTAFGEREIRCRSL